MSVAPVAVGAVDCGAAAARSGWIWGGSWGRWMGEREGWEELMSARWFRRRGGGEEASGEEEKGGGLEGAVGQCARSNI